MTKSPNDAPLSRNGRRRRRLSVFQSTDGSQRKLREDKIRDLLPDEDEEELGKAYDGRLVRRLLVYNQPYLRQLITAIFLMIVTSLRIRRRY